MITTKIYNGRCEFIARESTAPKICYLGQKELTELNEYLLNRDSVVWYPIIIFDMLVFDVKDDSFIGFEIK